MKKFLFSLLSLLPVISACSDSGGNSSSNMPLPVISAGIASSHILHDTPKIGAVSFQSENQGSSYNWDILNAAGVSVLGTSETAQSLTYNFTAAGRYTVILTVDGKEYGGVIDIPSSQDYAIDMGDKHTIISDKGSHALYVYGSNSHGQLCADTGSLKVPSLLISYPNVTSVAAGANHTLFVDTYVYGCGDNSNGQLGLGDTEIRKTPAVIYGVEFQYGQRMDVAAGGNMSIAGANVLDGSSPKVRLYSWGYDETAGGGSNAQTVPKLLLRDLPPARNEPLYSAGVNFAILRATSNYNVFSLGINDKWQLGRIFGAGISYDADALNPDTHTNLNKTDMDTGFVYAPYGSEALEYPPSYFQNNYFARLAAGDDFSVVVARELTTDDEWVVNDVHGVFVWGANDKGQLGFENKDNETFVRRPTALFNAYGETAATGDPNGVIPIKKAVTEVAAGKAHGLAVSDNGVLYGWGENTKSQLTSNNRENAVNNKVVEIANPAGVSSGYKNVWAGGDRTIALAGDGNLWTWGDNEGGILGINSDEPAVDTPKKLMFKIKPVN